MDIIIHLIAEPLSLMIGFIFLVMKLWQLYPLAFIGAAIGVALAVALAVTFILSGKKAY